MTRPITFSCSAAIPLSAGAIADEIANLERWPDFNGYGPLPGIKHAAFERSTAAMPGARILVTNTDGSRHIEDILEWQPGSRIVMKLHQFTPPLSLLASHFIEDWNFMAGNGETHVTRAFQLFPRGPFTRPALWGISLLFRRAIRRHLAQMAAGT